MFDRLRVLHSETSDDFKETMDEIVSKLPNEVMVDNEQRKLEAKRRVEMLRERVRL